MEIYRMPDLTGKVVKLSRSTIYAKIKDGSFPKPIRLGERAIGWKSETIEKWLADQEKKEQGGNHE